jgi:hypothetical protein
MRAVWDRNPGLMYKVVQIWPGLFVCKQVTVCPGHIWTTLYILNKRQAYEGAPSAPYVNEATLI